MLQRKLTFRMTTYVMRCIKKAGGIDEYLMKTKDSEIKYDKAIAIKQELLAMRKAQKESAREVIAKREDSSKPSDMVGEKESPAEEQDEPRAATVPLKATVTAKFRSRGLLDLL